MVYFNFSEKILFFLLYLLSFVIFFRNSVTFFVSGRSASHIWLTPNMKHSLRSYDEKMKRWVYPFVIQRCPHYITPSVSATIIWINTVPSLKMTASTYWSRFFKTIEHEVEKGRTDAILWYTVRSFLVSH